MTRSASKRGDEKPYWDLERARLDEDQGSASRARRQWQRRRVATYCRRRIDSTRRVPADHRAQQLGGAQDSAVVSYQPDLRRRCGPARARVAPPAPSGASNQSIGCGARRCRRSRRGSARPRPLRSSTRAVSTASVLPRAGRERLGRMYSGVPKTKFLVAVAFLLATSAAAFAQQTQPPATPPQDHQHASTTDVIPLFESREASGTAWLPVDTPMYAIHQKWGGWNVMLHGIAFGQLLYEPGDIHRTGGYDETQAGSVNWGMLMARRSAGKGRLGLRAMVSLEPWTLPRLRRDQSPGHGRDVRRRHDSRSSASARSLHGACGGLRSAAARFVALAGLWRTRRGTSARPGRIPASRVVDAESDCADLAPLARFDAHHVRARHDWHLRSSLEGGDVRLQRPRARRGPLGPRSRSARFVLGAFHAAALGPSGAAGIGRPPRRSRSRVPAAATNGRRSPDSIGNVSPQARCRRDLGNDLRVRLELRSRNPPGRDF